MKGSNFPKLLQHFFTQRLMQQRQVSPVTSPAIRSPLHDGYVHHLKVCSTVILQGGVLVAKRAGRERETRTNQCEQAEAKGSDHAGNPSNERTRAAGDLGFIAPGSRGT